VLVNILIRTFCFSIMSSSSRSLVARMMESSWPEALSNPYPPCPSLPLEELRAWIEEDDFEPYMFITFAFEKFIPKWCRRNNLSEVELFVDYDGGFANFSGSAEGADETDVDCGIVKFTACEPKIDQAVDELSHFAHWLFLSHQGVTDVWTTLRLAAFSFHVEIAVGPGPCIYCSNELYSLFPYEICVGRKIHVDSEATSATKAFYGGKVPGADHCTTLNGDNGSTTGKDDVDFQRFSPDFALHGKYVGPGHTGGPKLGVSDFSTRPVDALDAAARRHDWAYRFANPKLRRAADFVLAREAFTSIAKVEGFAKAKAAFVSAGMWVKGMFGPSGYTGPLPEPYSLDIKHKPAKLDHAFVAGRRVPGVHPVFLQGERTRYHHDPVVSDAPGVMAQKSEPDALPTPQLNGNNGSATNSDDVSKRQKSKSQPKRSAGPKTKSVAKQRKPKPRQEKVVEASLVAPVQNTVSTVAPFYKPYTHASGRGVKTAFTLGHVAPAGPTSSSAYVVGGVVASWPIDKSVTVGESIGDDFGNHERFRIMSARYHFIPEVGSTINGSIAVMSDADTTDILPTGGNAVVSQSVLDNHKGTKFHTLWNGAFSGTMTVNKEWLFTDAELITLTASRPVAPSGDPRLYSAGTVAILNGAGIPSTALALGQFLIELDVQFRDTQHSDLDRLVVSAKIVSGTAFENMPVAGFNPILHAFANSIGYPQTTSSGAYEICYNPRLLNPASGSMFLPCGIYGIRIIVGMTGTATITASTIAAAITVLNATFSSDVFGSLDYAWANPEFVNPPTTTPTWSSTLILHGRVRVTQVLLGTYATVLPLFSAITASVVPTIQGYHISVIREPDFLTLPIASPFPAGNANGFIGVSKLVHVVVHNAVVGVDHRFILMKASVLYSAQVRDVLVTKAIEKGFSTICAEIFTDTGFAEYVRTFAPVLVDGKEEKSYPEKRPLPLSPPPETVGGWFSVPSRPAPR